MADDEQFSLCWNNFNSNLSAGFHESLCRGDLVDVTLAAEGQFVKAHRLVLSVCSPFFRRMFSHMPANQHAFVFLKDVSHAALKDLIQFMYCGEVNVKQDALPAFISTAESLQIKGLTDGEPGPVQSPIKSSTPAPQQTACVNLISNVPRQKPSKCLPKYKIETDDSDDKGEQVAVPAQTGMKRQTQRTSTSQSSSAIKKLKSGDTLESISSPQIPLPAEDGKTTRQEFIDLPLDVSTKVEPDYTSDARETSEQETYVEDDSYGDMKYDENYFTENEETGVNATNTFKQSGSFSETYITESGDQTTNETQGYQGVSTTHLRYSRTQRGRAMLVYAGYKYVENRQSQKNIFWRCSKYVKHGCRATVVTSKASYSTQHTIRISGPKHTHSPDVGCDDIIENES